MGKQSYENQRIQLLKAFSQKLQRLCDDAGSQAEVARAIGKPPQEINKWANQENMPSLVNLCKLADYFGISLDDLLGREKENTDDQLYTTAGEVVNAIKKMRRSIADTSISTEYIDEEDVFLYEIANDLYREIPAARPECLVIRIPSGGVVRYFVKERRYDLLFRRDPLMKEEHESMLTKLQEQADSTPLKRNSDEKKGE